MKFLLLLVIGITLSTILIYFTLNYLDNPQLAQNILSYSEFEGERHIENICSEDIICYGIYENQTIVPLACDMNIHGCPKIPVLP